LINNLSFRILLVTKLTLELQASVVNMETTFLNVELQEEIYMNIPEGLDTNSNHCLQAINLAIHTLILILGDMNPFNII
jgi:hypothetical protein